MPSEERVSDKIELRLSEAARAAAQRHTAPQQYEPISEPLIREFYSKLLRSGDSALDVGVHYGIHLFAMAQAVGSAGRVFGIEANPERVAWLQAQLKARNIGQATLIQGAATDRSQECRFFIHTRRSGLSGLLPNLRPGEEDGVLQEISVRGFKIDEIPEIDQGIRFIKLDIEGAEWGALIGAEALVSRCKPVIVFEGSLVESARKLGYDPQEPFGFASRHNFAFFSLFGTEIRPGDWWGPGWNFIACRRDAATLSAVEAALDHAWATAIPQG